MIPSPVSPPHPFIDLSLHRLRTHLTSFLLFLFLFLFFFILLFWFPTRGWGGWDIRQAKSKMEKEGGQWPELETGRQRNWFLVSYYPGVIYRIHSWDAFPISPLAASLWATWKDPSHIICFQFRFFNFYLFIHNLFFLLSNRSVYQLHSIIFDHL